MSGITWGVVPVSFLVSLVNNEYQVVTAVGLHLFPFRTEKLSPLAPMVLRCVVEE